MPDPQGILKSNQKMAVGRVCLGSEMGRKIDFPLYSPALLFMIQNLLLQVMSVLVMASLSPIN